MRACLAASVVPPNAHAHPTLMPTHWGHQDLEFRSEPRPTCNPVNQTSPRTQPSSRIPTQCCTSHPAWLQVLNFPAIDALIQPSSLLQMTIMQKCDINTAGLSRAQKQLRGSSKRLYFVVPASMFDEYRLVKGVCAEVEQWVLEMDTPAG